MVLFKLVLVMVQIDTIQFNYIPIAGEKHHITFVSTHDKAKLYIDGKLVDTKSDPGVSGNNSYETMAIGDRGDHDRNRGWNPMDGEISNFQIYNKALTTDEIAKVSKGATVDGLVAHYEFNDPNDLGKDSTGKHNGVNHGAVQVDGPTKTVMIDKDVEVSFYHE